MTKTGRVEFESRFELFLGYRDLSLGPTVLPIPRHLYGCYYYASLDFLEHVSITINQTPHTLPFETTRQRPVKPEAQTRSCHVTCLKWAFGFAFGHSHAGDPWFDSLCAPYIFSSQLPSICFTQLCLMTELPHIGLVCYIWKMNKLPWYSG